MSEQEKSPVDEMKAAGMLFVDELAAINGVKQSVLEAIQANQSPTSQTIGRQTFDHLDAASLFLQNLGMYLKFMAEQVEAGVAAQPGLKIVDEDGQS